MKTDKTVKHEGAEIRLVLRDFYCNIGGRIEQTTVLNPGTDKEKVMPASTITIPINRSIDFGQPAEQVEAFIKDNPEIATMIAVALNQAAEQYK